MGRDIHTVTGGRMCGAVRYKASGEPVSVIQFHCLSCRRHTNALAPQFYIHHDERIGWFEIAAGLPRYHVRGDDGSEPYRHAPAIAGPSARGSSDV